jgi:hypothetical protein
VPPPQFLGRVIPLAQLFARLQTSSPLLATFRNETNARNYSESN